MEKKLIDKFGEDTIQRRAQAILNADFFSLCKRNDKCRMANFQTVELMSKRQSGKQDRHSKASPEPFSSTQIYHVS